LVVGVLTIKISFWNAFKLLIT